MYRKNMEFLKSWKDDKTRHPLLVIGVRQAGKTWLLKEFGRTCFQSTAYVNFEDSQELRDICEPDLDPKRIVRVLETLCGFKVTPGGTLLILDEIQAAPKMLTALRYFYEMMPDLHVVAAGSLLGVAMRRRESFPVGRVQFLDVRPMSFAEFLAANGEERFVELLREKDWKTVNAVHDTLLRRYHDYLFVGGMPEAVAAFVGGAGTVKIRQIQRNILQSYEADFAKYAPLEALPRMRMVWQSLPEQLAKENKRFIFGALKPGARARDFELAIEWLLNAGLALKCARVRKPGLPLSAYGDFTAFKLYMSDVGLLTARMGLMPDTLADGTATFTQAKGIIAEQFVMQELSAHAGPFAVNAFPSYWTNDRGTVEIDFLVQRGADIIPVEVKSGENTKAKSFRNYCAEQKPRFAFRASPLPYKDEGWMANIPIYAIARAVETDQEAHDAFHPAE